MVEIRIIKWKISKCRLLTKNCWESMEKQLNSSGIFSLDFHHCRFFESSRKFCEDETSNLKNSQTGSYLCQCSTEIRHHLVNVQTMRKSLQNFVRRKRKPLLRDTSFFILMFLQSAELDSVRSNSLNNPKNRAQKLEPRRDLLLGLSDVLHHGRVAGVLVFENWWHGWRSP